MDEITRIVVPGGSSETWLGSQLLTPTNPAGLSAGTVSGTGLVLDANNEAGGTPPNTGLAWPVGRHRLTYNVTVTQGSLNYAVVVRNITDSTDAAIATYGLIGTFSHVLQVDSVAGKSYQPQVKITAVAGSPSMRVTSIAHEFVPFLAQNDQARSDPERTTVEKLESDGDLVATLSTEGSVPFWLPPGLTAIFVVPLDVPKGVGYTDPESVKGRTVQFSAKGAPRYLG